MTKLNNTRLAKQTARLAKIAKHSRLDLMSTMNISIPPTLKKYVDSRTAEGDYGSTSEYVRDLIRKDKDREDLRTKILSGIESPSSEVDEQFFERLRAKLD
jgi:putative addiction module antidote protein, CC2985 family